MTRELSEERRLESHVRYSEGAIVASGAVVGAAVAYLVLTPQGRRLCEAIIDALDTFSAQWSGLCRAATRARSAAEDGWEALDARSHPLDGTRM